MPDGMSPVQVKRRTKPAARSIASIVDELGLLKAQMADLADREKSLKSHLIACGRSECDGSMFRATVSRADRVTLDSNAVRSVLGEELCRQFEKRSEVVTVRVVARTQTSKSRAA